MDLFVSRFDRFIVVERGRMASRDRMNYVLRGKTMFWYNKKQLGFFVLCLSDFSRAAGECRLLFRELSEALVARTSTSSPFEGKTMT